MVTTHAFTLIIEGDLDNEAKLDELYEAGCDDATFGRDAQGVSHGRFDREAASYEEAVSSAVQGRWSRSGSGSSRSTPTPDSKPPSSRRLFA